MPPSPSSPASKTDRAREIWLVDKAPDVIEKLQAAVKKLDDFMKSQGLDLPSPRPCPISRATMPARLHQAFQGSPAAQNPARPIHRPHRGKRDSHRAGSAEGRAQRLPWRLSGNRPAPQGAAGQGRRPAPARTCEQLDFEFVLFASAVIDYDYIMGLIARYSAQDAGQAEDEPRTAHRPHSVRCQVHGRARGHRRLHPHPEGGRRLERKGHPRRLPAFQGGEERRRNSPPSPQKHGLADRPRCKPSWTASSNA